MPNTANRAYPYPTLAQTPNVPRDVQALAVAVDADVQAMNTLQVNNQGSSITLTTAAQTMAALTAPAGKWLIKCSGQLDVSVGAGVSRNYSTRLYTPSGSLLVPVNTLVGAAKSYFYFELEQTFAAPTAIALQAYVDTVSGTSLAYGGKLIIQPVIY